MFIEIPAQSIKENLIEMISKEYMLITAGDQTAHNMMTASWGFMGEMWGNDAVAVVIRPQRYTMEFVNKHDYFTLGFFGDNKDVHKICGGKSGRDCNKTELCKLSPVFENDTVYFKEARLVIVCKKQYVQQMDPTCFTDKTPLKWYPSEDYHYTVIGKIEKVLVNVD